MAPTRGERSLLSGGASGNRPQLSSALPAVHEVEPPCLAAAIDAVADELEFVFRNLRTLLEHPLEAFDFRVLGELRALRVELLGELLSNHRRLFIQSEVGIGRHWFHSGTSARRGVILLAACSLWHLLKQFAEST